MLKYSNLRTPPHTNKNPGPNPDLRQQSKNQPSNNRYITLKSNIFNNNLKLSDGSIPEELQKNVKIDHKKAVTIERKGESYQIKVLKGRQIGIKIPNKKFSLRKEYVAIGKIEDLQSAFHDKSQLTINKITKKIDDYNKHPYKSKIVMQMPAKTRNAIMAGCTGAVGAATGLAIGLGLPVLVAPIITAVVMGFHIDHATQSHHA